MNKNMLLVVIIVIATAIFYFCRFIDRKFFNKSSLAHDAIERLAGGISLSGKGYILLLVLYGIFILAIIKILPLLL